MPFETVNGKRRWKPPSAEKRAERGLSVLTPEQTGHVSPATKAVQAGDPTGGGMSTGFAAKYKEALTQQQTGQLPEQQVGGIRLTETGSITEDFKKWWGAQTSTPEGEKLIKPGSIEKAISAFVTAATVSLITYYGLGILGLGKLATVATGLKVTAKSTALYRTTGQLAANPATTTQILKAAWKSGYVKTGILLYMLKEAQSDIVFGKFQLVEGLDKLGYARTKLVQLGLDDTPIGIEVENSIDQYTEAMNWFRMNIPILGSKIGTDKNIKAAEISKRAWDTVAAEEKRRLETGDDFAASAKKLDQDRRDQDLIWREEDKIYWEQVNKNRKEARKEDRLEEAAYWDNIFAEREARRKKEQEEMEAYWEEVRKKQAKYQEENRRSNLVFGLLGK